VSALKSSRRQGYPGEGWGSDRRREVIQRDSDSTAVSHPAAFDRGAQFGQNAKRSSGGLTAVQSTRVETTSPMIRRGVAPTKRLLAHIGDKQKQYCRSPHHPNRPTPHPPPANTPQACTPATRPHLFFIREQPRSRRPHRYAIAVLRANRVAAPARRYQTLRASTATILERSGKKVSATERGRVLVQAYRALCGSAQERLNARCEPGLLAAVHAWGRQLARQGLVRGDDQSKGRSQRNRGSYALA